METAESTPPARRFVVGEDLRVLRKLVSDYVSTAWLPARLDRWLVPRKLRKEVPPERLEPWPGMTEVERRMRFVLEPLLPDLDFRAQAARHDELRVETRWLRARALHRSPLRVTTRVDGLEHVRRGALLWGMSFGGTLMVKVALARAGVPLVHLSAAGHGAADPATTVGLRVVSPLYCLAENRFLAERVVIPPDGSLTYMRTLIRRLEEGRVVYISGERLSARQNTIVPCLGRPTPYARGAPGIAHKTGAPLHPVAVFREGMLDYRAVIGEAIEADRSLPRGKFTEQATALFANRVERTVVAHPSDWEWYRHTVPLWEAAAE